MKKYVFFASLLIAVCFGNSAWAVSCTAGTYLAAGDSTCSSCENGYYCPGGDFDYDENNAGGLNSCPDDYDMSDANASSQDNCFKNYTCPALAPYDCEPHAAACTYVSGTDTGYEYADGTITATCEKSFNSCTVGYDYIPAATIPELPALSKAGNSYQYRAFPVSGGYTSNSDNDLVVGEWKVTWSTGSVDDVLGTLKGRATCVSTSSSGSLQEDQASVYTGRFCWCLATSWTPINGSAQNLSASWIYQSDGVSNTGCGKVCPRYCAEDIRKASNTNGAKRASLYNALKEEVERCERNTSVNLYTCNPGEYLKGGETTCRPCPATKWCPGGEFTDSASDQGINACPNGYVNSSEGTASQDQCYSETMVSCTTVNPYTGGNGTADYSEAMGDCRTYYSNPNSQTCTGCNYTSLTCDSGFHQVGSVTVLAELDKTIDGDSMRYRNLDDTYPVGDQTGLGLGDWAVSFSYGEVKGTSLCSSTQGYAREIGDPDLTFGGSCWCKATLYTPTGESGIAAETAWVSTGVRVTPVEACSSTCSNTCASWVKTNYSNYRTTLFNPTLKCVQNVINLNWYDENTVWENNSCKYNAFITLPETNPTRTGFTFGGWVLDED